MISYCFCMCCGLQDQSHTNYSANEAIQTPLLFDSALVTTTHENQKETCAYASADFKYLRTTSLIL